MVLTEPISARLPREDLQQINQFAQSEHLDRSAFVKRLIDRGLQGYKLEKAIGLYEKGAVSLGKARALAGMQIWDFLDVLKEKKVTFSYDVEEFKKDLEGLRK